MFYSLEKGYCEDILCNDVYKIEVELKPREVKKVQLINNDYIKSSLFVLNKKTYLEITSSKNNNCKAVELLMKLEEIKKADVTAILGNDSEIDLLRHIKNSYVVSNAKEIKKLATNKTKSNNAKGSENIIKKI
jgi:hydroxymethylpyrimidine pyrophosphatase-like HAD family hydrolase